MKILVVQTSFLGDAILSSPVISALTELFPSAEIWILTTPLAADLYRFDPRIAGIITFDKRSTEAGPGGMWSKAKELRAHKFDRAYGLQRSLRTSLMLYLAGIPLRIGFREATGSWLYHERFGRQGWKHEVERTLAILGPDVAGSAARFPLKIQPPPNGILQPDIQEFLGSAAPYVAVIPGSVWPTKRWSTANYRALCQRLCAAGNRVALLGAPDEVEICNAVGDKLDLVSFAGRTNIGEMVSLIANARAVVCNDSMSLHLASAFMRPTVALFCSTVPDFGFGPWQNEHARVLEVQGLKCKPCGRHGRPACPLGTDACMIGIKAEQVISAFGEIGVAV